MDITDRKARLKRWQDAYFNLEPEVTDQEYDTERDAIAKLEPDAIEIVAVGAPPPKHSVWEKVEHEIKMGSLRKANSMDEILDWAGKCLNSLPRATSFFITHKLDGSSMELVYVKGKLTRCVTRGDGLVGEDVTGNISQVPNIPKLAKWDVDFTVRGEIIMEIAIFKEHYAAEYANPRNTAAALVRKKKSGGAECKHLKFLAHGVVFPDMNDHVGTMNRAMERVQSLGFEVPPGSSHEVIDEVLGVYDRVKGERNKLPYEIDGMVVSINNLSTLEAMGEVSGRPLGQIAWKFDAAMAETKMVDVKWKVGLSGRVTPVAVVEPVNIGGVVVTNISLHNLTMFRELKLFAGCRVLISRRNDVIPFLEKNLDAA